MIDWIGYTAAFCTTAAFVPQAWQVHRTRQTHDLSLGMFLLFTAGVALWGVHGLMTMQWSIILANGVTVILAALILAMKVHDVLAARRVS